MARISDRGGDRVDERQTRKVRMGNASRSNRFAINFDLIPPGMTLEWKRMTIMGQEDRHNQVQTRLNAWEPVPHSQQPQILGHFAIENPEQPIVVDGLMLMQRPTYLCEEAEDEVKLETEFKLGQQLASLKLSSREQIGAERTKIITRHGPASAQPVD